MKMMRNYSLKAIFLAPFFCAAILSALSAVGQAEEPKPAESKSAEMWLFLTTDGERIIGELTNPDEKPRTQYVIKLADGKTVTVAAKKMKNRRKARPEEAEYERRKATVANTVEAQWELAEWCRQHRMSSNRKTHLERIIQIDPDHKEARKGLGYQLVDGKWMTQEDIQASRGYFYYKGAWRTQQQIDTLKKNEKYEKEEKKWFVAVKRYLGWLGTSRTDAALKELSEITDPAAIRAVDGFLTGDQPENVKLLLVKVLVNISKANPKDHGTHLPLAVSAYEDPYEEVRLSCLDYLKKAKDPGVTRFFTGKLNVTLATRKYKADANMMINRAAYALGELKDESAVKPLIGVLITEHKEKVTSGNPGQTSATFSNRGGSGLSMGSKTKIVTHHIKNQDVLDALKKITGVSFNFDVEGWEAWYDQQGKQIIPDTRRGP